VIDVLVAGGGPVGLATAIGCALAGLSVAVAEPRADPVDKACGEGVMPAAVRRLAALGVTPDGRPLRGIRYLDASHRADAPFRHGDGRGVRRTVLHAALAARAASLGVAVLPARVTGFSQHDGHVTAAGVEARYLVAADGLHSPIRRALERDAPSVPGGTAGRPEPDARNPAQGYPAQGHQALGHSARGGLARGHPAPPRYGLRRHYRVVPWTDLVEVYWTAGAEAYVTPVSADVVGVGLLFARPDRSGTRPGPGSAARGKGSTGSSIDGGIRGGTGNGTDGGFEARLAVFPALAERLGSAAPASEVRGAGPLRQDVRRRVYGRVLLVGDASGYLDALTGEGIGVGLAQAEVLTRCLAAGRPADYERAWRRVSRPAWRLTAGLLWSRNQPLLAPHIVPAAQRLPWLFSALVNHAAQA
jgi:2-polyprenyl-6-methoxyphenol hydroxylase-like FAD-dependent oxidoreductase